MLLEIQVFNAEKKHVEFHITKKKKQKMKSKLTITFKTLL